MNVSIGGIPVFMIGGKTPNPYLVIDSFTDANATALASHTPNKGGTWVDVTAGITIESNKASDNQADRLSVIDCADADVVIEADLVLAGSNFFGIVFRYQDSTHYWIAGCDILNNATRIWINNAGWTQKATNAHTYTNGDAVSIKVILNGTSIKVDIDGTNELSITDATLQTETKHGLYEDGVSWAADGTWDNFAIRA